MYYISVSVCTTCSVVFRTELKLSQERVLALPCNKNNDEDLIKYRKCGRPYLIASGLEDGIKYIFTMSPTMVKVASEADFMQCDITYDDCKYYPYIFNACGFQQYLYGGDSCG